MAASLNPLLPSWNPLRSGGTALPVNLLVMVKCIAIALLLTNHVRLLPDPFLPFIPGLDGIPPMLFQRTLQIVFLGSAIALLFNRKVRVSSFLLGLTMIAGVIASKAYYGNNKTFCGLILIFAGLYEPRPGAWLIRLQLIVVYLGAGLNKALDPDWRSGVFFENWAVNRLHQPLYIAIDRLLPPMALAKLMCWFTFTTELSLSVILATRPLWPLGIWVSLGLHSGMLLFTGSTFTMFFYAMTASMLAFVEWPAAPLAVLYDPDSRVCTGAKLWFERFDLEGMFLWQDGPGGLELRAGGKAYSGFRAVKMLILWNPVSYLLVYAILAAAGPGDSKFRNITVALLLILFSPILNPIGDRLFNLLLARTVRARHNYTPLLEDRTIPR